MTAIQLLIGLLTLVVNAFFVGAEFALISVRRSQVEPEAEAGDRRARSVIWGLEHVSALLAAAQLGITLCTLVLGIVAEPAIANLLEPVFNAVGVPHGLIHPISFVIALTLATYLHMLLGEMVPKNIALAEPKRTALLLGPPLVTLARTLRPVIFTVNAFANGLLKLLRVEAKGRWPPPTRTTNWRGWCATPAMPGCSTTARPNGCAMRWSSGAGRCGTSWCRWSGSCTPWSGPRPSSWSGWRRNPGSPASRWWTRATGSLAISM